MKKRMTELNKKVDEQSSQIIDKKLVFSICYFSDLNNRQQRKSKISHDNVYLKMFIHDRYHQFDL